MTEENSLECPNCGKRRVVRPTVYHGVFRETRQPDGVCGNCGAFYWKHPEETISFAAPNLAVREEEQKTEKFNWFETFVKQEREKKRGRRRWSPL